MSAPPALPVTTILLVLASAAIHAVWNAILKRTKNPEHAVVGVLVVSAATSAVIALVVAPPLPSNASIAWCVASGVLEAFYFVTLARALSRAPLGPVYTTVRGGSLVVVWPISIAFLGEHVSPFTLAGTMLVVFGLVATGASENPRAPRVGEAAAPALASRLGWAAVCAGFVGGYQIAYKLALVTGGQPAAVVALSLVSACIVNLAAGGPARVRVAWTAARAEPIRVLSAGVLTTVGFAVFLYAMKDAGAGLVVTLRNTSILFAQLVAFMTGDRPKRLGVVGAVLVTLGAVLLARR